MGGVVGTVRPVIRRRALLVTAAVTLTVAGCGGSSSTGDETDAATADAPATASADDPSTASETTASADGPTPTAGADDEAAPAPATAPATAGGDPGSEEPDTNEAPAPVEAPEALRFTAPLVGGGELDVATLADKPTVFWFWAPT